MNLSYLRSNAFFQVFVVARMIRKQIFWVFLILAFANKAEARSDTDTLFLKFARFKKYMLPNGAFGDKWVQRVLRFNTPCDSIRFEDSSYSATEFSLVFNQFMSSKLQKDTIVLFLDLGNTILIDNYFCSIEILANEIEKKGNLGVYYFSILKEKNVEKNYTDMDTIDVYSNKSIKYNEKPLNYNNLSKQLQMQKPNVVLIRIDPDIYVCECVEIMKTISNLKIKMVLKSAELTKKE